MNKKERYVLGSYHITRDGRVYSYYTKKFLRPRVDKDGYLDVSLVYNKDGERMPFRIHRLVALKYIKKTEGNTVVNHKDLDKQNNNVENLEWTTVQKNTQHGYDNGAYKSIARVKSVEPDGTVHVFPSTSHAARFYGYQNSSGVQEALKGRTSNPVSRGKRKGIFFEYTDEGVTTIERVIVTADNE